MSPAIAAVKRMNANVRITVEIDTRNVSLVRPEQDNGQPGGLHLKRATPP
jgi:hypothetical protein